MKELGRLLNKKTITIMIAAACICVAAIFARDSSDCGISNYGVKAREYMWIAAGHSEEEIQQHTDELSQDNRRIFKRLAKEYAEKTAYIEGYADSVKAVITSASNMKKFSIFGTTDSMSNINKTEKDYKRIENVDVTMMNSRAAEQFLKYDISIYIVLALMIYVIYSIYEYRDNGMWQITYTAVNGRMRLAAKGVIGIGVITMASAFIMQICGLAAMLCVYGGWNTLTAPVQCLTGYNNYTLPVNVITYLFIRYVVMCVIVFTLSLVISLVSALCRKRIGAMVLVGIIAGAEAFAYQNISMQSSLRVFRKINIINVMNVSSILKKYDNVTIAGASVSVTNVLCIVCVIISIVAAILLILLGKLVRPGRGIGSIGKIIEKIGQLNQVVLFRLPHFWKETYKVLITARGWIVVCVVLFMTVFICNNQKITYSDDEQKKDEYYQQYGGSDYSGFTAIIEQRRKDVQEAESRLETAQEQYDRGEIDENTVSRYVYNLMDAQRILDSMSEYIQQIEYVKQVKEEYGIDAYVMSQRGYDQILGDKGAARRLLIYVVLGFGVVLIAEAENSVEYKNSMNIRKMFLTGAVICSCVLCAGCKNQNEGQTDDDTQTIQNQADNKQTDNMRIYEENGVRYCEESGVRQKITYPLFKVSDMEWEQAGTYNMQYHTSEQDVRSGDSSYLSLQESSWPKLYDKEAVETIQYTAYNARVQFVTNDVQLKDCMSQKDIRIESVSIDSAKQDTLNMIIYMEFPATTESWYMNKQSPEVRNQRLSDILNSAIIEADDSYTDGMHKTDYYKIETDGTTRYNLYKCEGN